MATYLVTGGLGVVGSRVVDRLVESGKDVLVIDAAEEPRNRWTAARLVADHGDRVSISEERLESADLSAVLPRCEAVIHAAAHTGIPHSSEDPGDDWVSNVDATRHLLESVRRSGSRIPVVMTSSVKPYRTSGIPCVESEEHWDVRPGFHGVDEDFPLDPDEPYAASKMAQSALGTAYARSFDMPVCVLRCSNLYGDAPCHGPRHGWLTWFCIAAAVGWKVELQGTGKQTRDVLYTDDVASACLAALGSEEAMSGSVFNIGGGVPNAVSCRQAVRLISGHLGRQMDTVPGPGRKNEDVVFVTDHRRFTGATGWRPAVGVSQGIARIVQWATGNADDLREIYRDEVEPRLRD